MPQDGGGHRCSLPGAECGVRSLTTFHLGAGAAGGGLGIDPAAAEPNDQGGGGPRAGLGPPAPPAGPTGQCEGGSLSPDPGEPMGRGVASQEAVSEGDLPAEAHGKVVCDSSPLPMIETSHPDGLRGRGSSQETGDLS